MDAANDWYAVRRVKFMFSIFHMLIICFLNFSSLKEKEQKLIASQKKEIHQMSQALAKADNEFKTHYLKVGKSLDETEVRLFYIKFHFWAWSHSYLCISIQKKLLEELARLKQTLPKEAENKPTNVDSDEDIFTQSHSKATIISTKDAADDTRSASKLKQVKGQFWQNLASQQQPKAKIPATASSTATLSTKMAADTTKSFMAVAATSPGHQKQQSSGPEERQQQQQQQRFESALHPPAARMRKKTL